MEKEETEQTNKVQIKYEDSFVAFLDVLGFTDFVKNDKIDKISDYLVQVETAMNNLKELLTKKKVDLNYIIISDSIIISVKQNKKDNLSILNSLCNSIRILQSFLAYNDIWLRGAISSGEAYFNKERNQIIGKAYINAYLLESKILNPQVIIDNKIIKELKFSNAKEFINAINILENRPFKVLYNWENNTHIKKEFPLFIDYLSLYVNNNNLSGIEKILINIENNIYSKIELYSKYKWVTDYILSLIDKNTKLNKFKERLEKL